MKEAVIPLAGALTTAIAGMIIAWLLARVRSARLGRTLDQANKIIEFVDRISKAHAGLTAISEANRVAEELMLGAMQAVRADFAEDRAVLPVFEEDTAAFRRAFLLYVPNRTML